MARLEVELAGVGFDKFSKNINDSNKEISTLEASLKKASANFQKANSSALSLEKDLKSLNDQFKAGSVSGDIYAKEQEEIRVALSDSRQEAQKYQAQMSSINATMRNGVTQIDVFGNQTKKITTAHASFANGIRSSNSVAIEFNRIIQDAPFGLMGIGNNIQQLTANYQQYATSLRTSAAEQGKSITTGQILKGALGGIISPINLLTLGVSAVTAGWTAYSMWAQKSAKATKEAEGAAKSYEETLKGVNRAQFEGTKNALKDLTNLKLLYNAYQNANLPLKDRKIAYQQIQQEYPDYFKNIAFEEKASKATKTAYDQLTGSILATSRARAAANLITKNSERQLENENKIIAIQAKLDKERLQIQKDISRLSGERAAGSAGVGAAQGVGLASLREQSEKRINDLISQQNNLKTDSNILSKENAQLEKSATDQIAKGGKLIELRNTKEAKTKTPIDRSGAIVARSEASADLSGLTGVDREVETVRQRYIKLYSDLSANAKKSTDARKTFESDFNKLQVNEAHEIGTIIISEQQRVSNEIQRILNDSGVAANENRAKELAAVQKWYDAEIIKARDSSEIIVAINAGRAARIDAIDSKYEAKRIEAQTKLVDQITSLSEKQFTLNENFSNKTTQRNKEALKERLKDINDHFNNLKKLYANNPLALNVLGIAQTGVQNQTTTNFKAAENAGSDKVLSDLVTGFGTKFYQTLTTINEQADQSFTSIVGSLGESLSGMLQDTFSMQLSQILKDLVSGVKVSATQAVTALAGIAGGLVSGASKKTDSAGQALGGALTGGAAGFAVGGPIGAVAGGILGALGGLLGASKARKQEQELQKQQLDEARKQTELMRQNATAYTSSIIGRMTDQGVLTNVEVGAFGQLKAVVNGKQIDFILDRTNNSR